MDALAWAVSLKDSALERTNLYGGKGTPLGVVPRLVGVWVGVLGPVLERDGSEESIRWGARKRSS